MNARVACPLGVTAPGVPARVAGGADELVLGMVTRVPETDRAVCLTRPYGRFYLRFSNRGSARIRCPSPAGERTAVARPGSPPHRSGRHGLHGNPRAGH